MVGLQLLNLCLLKVMLRCCHDHKLDIRQMETRDMVRWVVLHALPYVRKSLHLENTQGNLQSGMPGSNSETHGRFCVGLGSNTVVFCWCHYYPPWLNYCKGVYRQVGESAASHDPYVISEQGCSFPRWQCSHSCSWNCSVLKSMKVIFCISGQQNQQIWTSLSHSCLVWWGTDCHLQHL
jgi:hypothetical protein